MGCEETNAQAAYNIGLVEIVVQREELMDRAQKLAQRMVNLPPSATAFAKKGINLAGDAQPTKNKNSGKLQGFPLFYFV